MISQRIEKDGWGKSTVQLLADHLQRTQPGIRGFSPQNLWRMRQFFETYRDTPELSTLSRELTWSSNLHILSRTKRPEEREFYLRMASRNRWQVREVARRCTHFLGAPNRAALFERSVLARPKLTTALRESHPSRRALLLAPKPWAISSISAHVRPSVGPALEPVSRILPRC